MIVSILEPDSRERERTCSGERLERGMAGEIISGVVH